MFSLLFHHQYVYKWRSACSQYGKTAGTGGKETWIWNLYSAESIVDWWSAYRWHSTDRSIQCAGSDFTYFRVIYWWKFNILRRKRKILSWQLAVWLPSFHCGFIALTSNSYKSWSFPVRAKPCETQLLTETLALTGFFVFVIYIVNTIFAIYDISDGRWLPPLL